MRKFFIILAVIILTSPVALYLVREPLVKMAINNVGTSMTGTEVSVDDVTLSPFSGFVALHGLKVANPEGYSQNNAMQVDEVRVRLTPSSLLSDIIKIQEITIDAPQVLVEGGIKENNLTALKNNLPQTAEGDASASGETSATDPRSVEIDLLQIVDASATITQPIKTNVKLDSITMRDIGKGDSSISLMGVAGKVINHMISVSGAAISAELPDEVKAKGKEALKNVTDKANGKLDEVGDKIGDKIKGLFGN